MNCVAIRAIRPRLAIFVASMRNDARLDHKMKPSMQSSVRSSNGPSRKFVAPGQWKVRIICCKTKRYRGAIAMGESQSEWSETTRRMIVSDSAGDGVATRRGSGLPSCSPSSPAASLSAGSNKSYARSLVSGRGVRMERSEFPRASSAWEDRRGQRFLNISTAPRRDDVGALPPPCRGGVPVQEVPHAKC